MEIESLRQAQEVCRAGRSTCINYLVRVLCLQKLARMLELVATVTDSASAVREEQLDTCHVASMEFIRLLDEVRETLQRSIASCPNSVPLQRRLDPAMHDLMLNVQRLEVAGRLADSISKNR